MESLSDEARDRRPCRWVLVDAKSDLACVPQEERDDDAGDQQQDQVRLAQVTARETLRPLHFADHERCDHAGEHQEREYVDEERVPALPPQPGQSGVLVHHADHRDGDGRQKHDEAPKDRGMHEAGQQALEQLALADDDDCFGPHSTRDVIESRRGLAHADESVDENGAAGEQPDRDDQDHRKNGGSYRVHLVFRISAEMAGTISFRSPTTA